MAKKRKRVYKIMKLTTECDRQIKDGVMDVDYDYANHGWDAECLADYFFMEYNPSEQLPEIDFYYRQHTMLTVEKHYRRCRTKVADSKYRTYVVCDEKYIISKFDQDSASYLEVYRTQDMDELARVFQLFNEYGSLDWWVDYRSFIDPFVSIMTE